MTSSARLMLPALFLAVACKQPQAEQHDHAQHDHAQHDHAQHDHAQHDHAQHDPAQHDPAQHAAHEGHAGHALPADAPLPGQSLYHLQATFTDQHGKPFALESLRGSPVIATMFYASCTSICPMLIAQVKRAHDALPQDARARTHVLLVSLDPARDTPDKLAELAKRHGVDDPLFHFARTDETHVRALAALLGIRYRALPEGEISHSPLLALLDRDGVLAMRMENAASDPAPLVAAATTAAKAQ